MQSREEFQHDMLRVGEFRLIRLHTQNTSGEIHVDIGHHSLATAPGYEALSYRWDTTSPMAIIIANGKSLQVMKPVFNFLHYHQSAQEPLYVWIDSVCIDQSKGKGDEEKQWQIPLMGEIYSGARCVVAWLNDVEVHPRTIELLTSSPKQTDSPKHDYDVLMEAFPEPETWGELADILAHEWFTRVWVLQEVALTKTMHIVVGKTRIDWDSVVSLLVVMQYSIAYGLAMRSASTSPAQAGSGLTSAMTIANCRRSRQRNMDLGLAMEYAVGMHATIDHDKIYAVLGFVDQGKDDVLLLPLYDTSPVEAYKKAMLHVLKSSRPLSILHLAGSGRQRSYALASWTPDFSLTNMFAWTWSNFPSWRAGFGLPHRLRLPSSGADDWIEICGNRCDELVQLTPLAHRRDRLRQLSSEQLLTDRRATYHDYRVWLDECLALTSQNSNGKIAVDEVHKCLRGCFEDLRHTSNNVQHPLHKLSKTLIAMPLNQDEPHSISNLLVSCKYFGVGLEQGQPVPWELHNKQVAAREEPSLDDETVEALTSFLARLGACSNRKLAATKNGHLAIVPPLCKEGDMVCILWGAETPYILRGGARNTDHDECFELIGCAYVDAYMDGSALKEEDGEMFRLV